MNCLGDLTLPYGEDVLPPSAEASNGPNAHPRINRKVTKSLSAVFTWVHTNTWNHPPPKLGPTHLDLPTNYLRTLSISKRTSAWKHSSKTPNQENPGDSESSIKPQNHQVQHSLQTGITNLVTMTSKLHSSTSPQTVVPTVQNKTH